MSWQQYGECGRFNYAQREYERTRPPVDCPNDGTPLEQTDRGAHCPADGWTWPPGRNFER